MKTLARAHDRTEIAERLQTMRPDSPRRWGRMSAHQMVCHLGDCLRMTRGDKEVRRADSLRTRTVVKWIALYLPMSWPGGRIKTRPEVDQEGGGTRPTEFAADVAAVVALMEDITTPDRDFHGRIHPTFGPMSHAEWLRLGYLHMDHHLRQFGA